MNGKQKMDDGRNNAISIRLSETTKARNVLKEKIKIQKAQGFDVTRLEKMLKAYDRDIVGYKTTLGI